MTDPRKILYLDIETKPSLVYTWQFWNVNITPEKIVEPGGLMCFAASWDDEKQVMFFDERDSWEQMVYEAWELLDKSDVIVTYNGNKFDLPHLQRAFTLAGLPSPSPYVSVDLFAVMKREQRGVWPSLRLAYLAQELEVADKLKNDGFDLWIRCMAGEKSAWNEMRKYNKRDVQILKEIFPLVRHKVKNMPSAGLYLELEKGEIVCPNCGSDHFQSRGMQRSKTRAYRRFQCQDCSTWFKGVSSEGSANTTNAA